MKERKKKVRNLKHFTYGMIVGYVFLIIMVTVCISYFYIHKSNNVLKTKVSSMTSNLNVQMQMNLDSYLDKMEKTATLIFANKEEYTYDATNPENDEYEALSLEEQISNSLYNYCIMENYVDFCIIYSNNHTVGKFSNGTKNLFGDSLYQDISSFITRQRTNDGWSTGYHDDYTRIYYVKQVNENAVLLTSFYTLELQNVFEQPEEIDDITIRLAENNNKIIYSSGDDELGSSVPDSILSRISEGSLTRIDDAFLITSTSCGPEWKVICSVPTDIILAECTELKIYMVMVCIIAAVIAAVLAILIALQISNPVKDMVNVLDEKAHADLLTGLLNKRSFEEFTENAIHNAAGSERYAIILLDVDNFKGVNDTLGHAYGDQVLSNIGSILRTVFKDGGLLGRIGGDEFCVFIKFPSLIADNDSAYISEKCEEICEAFRNNYTGDDHNYKISSSIGVATFPNNGKSFSELYQCADNALYQSKKKGKDTYTIYTEEIKK